MSSMIWDKVYKRSLLIENNILLGSYPAAVDVPFIFKVIFTVMPQPLQKQFNTIIEGKLKIYNSQI